MGILQMSLSASILILFTVLVRLLFKRRVPGDVLNILWGIVCCKLLFPFSMAAPFERLMTGSRRPGGMELPGQAGVLTIPRGIYMIPQRVTPGAQDAVRVLWLAGAACLGLYFICTYVRCVGIFQTALPAEGIVLAQEQRRGLIRHVSIRVSDRITSPLTYGIFRPVILLPRTMGERGGENLYYVLTHEMSHIRRLDCARKLCLAGALVCHWFNPLVWWMYYLANRDIELACDEHVIRSVGRRQRRAYADVLVEWASAKTEGNLLVSHLTDRFMEERIINIMKSKKITIAGIAISGMLIAGASVVYAASPGGSGAAETEAMKSSEITAILTDGADGILTMEIADDGSVRVMTGKPQEAAADTLADDPTLGGIFELYTPEEYAKVVENVKKYSDGGTPEDIRNMEADLERLKADNGKGEFVIYKGAFGEQYEEENGAMISTALDVRVIMAPEQLDRKYTAEEYKEAMEEISGILDKAVTSGDLTLAERDRIMEKMNQNLEKMK